VAGRGVGGRQVGALNAVSGQCVAWVLRRFLSFFHVSSVPINVYGVKKVKVRIALYA